VKAKLIKLKRGIPALASFFIPIGAYAYTLCPTVSVYADAGEFPTMAYLSGFGHPSGYPLFILILKLFLLLPFGQPAWKANLASAFIASLTCLIFFLLLNLLTRDKLVSLAGTFILAFSQIFWRNALIAEVFSLVAFFSVLTFLLFFLWQKTKKKKYFFCFALASGFGLAHHQILAISLFPLMIWFLLKIRGQSLRPKDCFFALLLLFSGYLPYLYISLAARNLPLMNWENPQTFKNLLKLALRSHYGFLQVTPINQEISPLVQIQGSLKLLTQSFTGLGILTFFLGLILGAKKKLPFCLWSGFVIASSSGLWIYSRIPFNQLVEFPYLERFLILSSFAIALISGIGLNEIKKWLQKVKKLPPAARGCFLLLLPGFIFAANYPRVSQKDNYFGQNFAEDLLTEIPKNSLFIIEGDPTINCLFYHQFVLGKRPDVKLVLGDLLISKLDWYFQELRKFYPEISLPEKYLSPQQFLLDFMVINQKEFPVYVNFPNLEKKLQLILNKELKGLVWEFSPKTGSQSLGKDLFRLIENQKNYQNILKKRNFLPEWPESSLKVVYARPQIQLAIYYENQNNFSEAKKLYLQAVEVFPHYFYAWMRLAEIFINEGQTEMAVTAWKKALFNPPDKENEVIVKNSINHYQNISK